MCGDFSFYWYLMHSKQRLLPKLFTALLCANDVMGFTLLTVRTKSSFWKTVETGKWFHEPRAHPCQEQDSFSPGMPGLGGGATGKAPPRLPNAPWAGVQLGLSRSCGWYQIRHPLMTAITLPPSPPSSHERGKNACRPVSHKRMQRFREQKTIQWTRD